MNTIKFYSVVDTNEIILFAVKILKSIATQVFTQKTTTKTCSLSCVNLCFEPLNFCDQLGILTMILKIDYVNDML